AAVLPSCRVRALFDKRAFGCPPPKEPVTLALLVVGARPPPPRRFFEVSVGGNLRRPRRMDRPVRQKQLTLFVVEALVLAAIALVVRRLHAKRAGGHAADAQGLLRNAVRRKRFETTVHPAGSVLALAR